LSIELLEVASAAFVSTIDPSGYPETRAMFNLRRKSQFPGLIGFFAENREDFLIYLTTNTSSSKVAHIKASPKVCIYYCESDEFRGLMLGGNIEIVYDEKIKEGIWQEGWKMYYPAGPHDPDNTILRLQPSFGRYYHRLDTLNFNFGERK
jgi:general stress protein 26